LVASVLVVSAGALNEKRPVVLVVSVFAPKLNAGGLDESVEDKALKPNPAVEVVVPNPVNTALSLGFALSSAGGRLKLKVVGAEVKIELPLGKTEVDPAASGLSSLQLVWSKSSILLSHTGQSFSVAGGAAGAGGVGFFLLKEPVS